MLGFLRGKGFLRKNCTRRVTTKVGFAVALSSEAKKKLEILKTRKIGGQHTPADQSHARKQRTLIKITPNQIQQKGLLIGGEYVSAFTTNQKLPVPGRRGWYRIRLSSVIAWSLLGWCRG